MPLQLERDMPTSAPAGADGQNASSAAGAALPRVKKALHLAFDTAGSRSFGFPMTFHGARRWNSASTSRSATSLPTLR
jgi:hypothetical protein